MRYSCSTCGKQLANRHSKWRHQKKYCRGSEVLSELKRAIEELKSLMVHGGNSLTTITNNVTTINNHVTINQYRCEDINHIQHDTIKAFNKRHDLNSSLRKLIEMIHFDREDGRRPGSRGGSSILKRHLAAAHPSRHMYTAVWESRSIGSAWLCPTQLPGVCCST